MSMNIVVDAANIPQMPAGTKYEGALNIPQMPAGTKYEGAAYRSH